MEAAVILGAGFSKNSGIPIQYEIPELLLRAPEKDQFEMAVTRVLEQFMRYIYGYEGKGTFPSLDDMFTCIDLSTNSGHHLGSRYSPMHLRAIRRLLVYRVFSVLHDYYKVDREVTEMIRLLLSSYSKIGFIVLNWDTVLEDYLRIISPNSNINYYNDGLQWGQDQTEDAAPGFDLLKIHGSSNWVYCDNCRSLFYDLNNHISNRKKAGLHEMDFMVLEELEVLPLHIRKELLNSESCQICGDSVSSHIATFSYRKSFRANAFSNIWKKAEEILSTCRKWIFIGYSLPDADYDFKHLLKISQLKLGHVIEKKLSVEVVVLNSDSTIKKYSQFFGNSLGNVYNGGVGEFLNKNYLFRQ